MVFPTFFNFSLNLAIRSSWSEPQSAPGLVFADYKELLHLWLQRSVWGFLIDLITFMGKILYPPLIAQFQMMLFFRDFMESHEGSESQSQLGPGWIPTQTTVCIRHCTTTALSFSFPICEMDMLILHCVLVRVEWMDWHVYHVTPKHLVHVVLRWWHPLLLFLLLLLFFLLLYFSRPLCCQNFIILYFCITVIWPFFFKSESKWTTKSSI